MSLAKKKTRTSLNSLDSSFEHAHHRDIITSDNYTTTRNRLAFTNITHNRNRKTRDSHKTSKSVINWHFIANTRKLLFLPLIIRMFFFPFPLMKNASFIKERRKQQIINWWLLLGFRINWKHIKRGTCFATPFLPVTWWLLNEFLHLSAFECEKKTVNKGCTFFVHRRFIEKENCVVIEKRRRKLKYLFCGVREEGCWVEY